MNGLSKAGLGSSTVGVAASDLDLRVVVLFVNYFPCVFCADCGLYPLRDFAAKRPGMGKSFPRGAIVDVFGRLWGFPTPPSNPLS